MREAPTAAGNGPLVPPRWTARGLLFQGANVALAAYLAYELVEAARRVSADSWPLDLAKYAGTAVIAVLVLFRSEPLAQRLDVLSVVAVLVSNWNYLLLDSGAASTAAPRAAGWILLTVAALWGSWSRIVLGRSFALLPSLRRLRTRGPYRVVRHPIYLSLCVADVGFLLLYPSLANAGVLALGIAATVLRLRLEEGVLASAPEWPDYVRATRWRLVPGVY